MNIIDLVQGDAVNITTAKGLQKCVFGGSKQSADGVYYKAKASNGKSVYFISGKSDDFAQPTVTDPVDGEVWSVVERG